MAIKLITTEDGSSSLYDEELNETYHSTRGALGESQYVFIEQGLNQKKDQQKIDILEVGFGTGLNALLTSQFASEKKLSIRYETLETVPLGPELYLSLNYEPKDLLNQIHFCEWEELTEIDSHFKLTKRNQSLEQFTTELHFDIIYFDAFAPSKQPEIWSLDNLRKCWSLLKAGGILVTYCSQGQFKRNLAEAGFSIEVLPGALGKKEMVRATK